MAVPDQVRRQSEDIAKLYEDLASDDPATAGEAGQTPGEAAPTTKKPELASAPTAKPAEQGPAGNTNPDETAEQRYRTLQGMYSADTGRLRTENAQLTNRVTQLETLISSFTEQKAATPAAIQKLITEKDVEDYGDSIDVMRRVTQEETAKFAAEMEALANRVNTMQSTVMPRVEQVAHNQAVSAEQNFWSELSRIAPDWQTVNVDPKFHDWLLEVDHLTGMTRQTYLDDAQRYGDVNRVAKFFETWKGINGQSIAQTPKPAAASQLERQVAPGRSNASGAANAGELPTYTQADIAKFFRDVTDGKFKGREDERDRKERDIFAAQQDGRITANG